MTRTSLTFLLLFVAVAAAAQPAPPPAWFCIAPVRADVLSGDCRDVTSDEIDVAADARARNWALLSGDRKLLVLGTLAPNATKVAVSRKRAAILSVNGSADRGWPAATKLTLAGREDQWTATIPANAIASLREIAVANGTYDLTVEAPRHFPLEKKGLRFSADVPPPVGELKLQPLPQLRGRFADKEGNPLPDVAVSTPEGVLLATSNAGGEVREELGTKIPPRLFAKRAGFGLRTIENARAAGDLDFGTIRMAAGGTLTLDIDRKDYAGPLTATLIRTHESTRGKRTTFASKTVNAETSRIVLEDLEARDYILILRGESALQTVMEKLSLAEEERKTMAIAIDASRVRALVHRGAAGYEGDVSFNSGNGEWLTSTRTDAHGRLELEAWFKGPVQVSVDPTPDSRYTASREVTSPLNEWDINLPDRKIRGVVVDKETGKPLPKAMVNLRYRLDGPAALGGMRMVRLRDDGTFELEMLDPGTFDFDARHDTYLPKSERVALAESERERTIRIELEQGRRVQVQVLDATGRPAYDAELLGVRIDRRQLGGRWPVDVNGIATVALAADETKRVWVVTPHGTFAPFTLRAADAGSKPVTVTLPPPVSTLVVRAVREDGSPVANVHVVFRHNGVFLDDDMRGYLARRGSRLQTGSDGLVTIPGMPAGDYEIWGMETPAANMHFDGRPLGNVVRLTALPGENAVKLVMAPRK